MLYKFIKLLPEDILSESLDETISDFSRSERRKYQKIKSDEEKIKNGLNELLFRTPFIKKLHLKYNSDSEFSGNEAYEEIINTINKSNSLSKVLYVLYRCCDTVFAKNYLNDFLCSEQFCKTVKNEWNEVTQAVADTTFSNTFSEEGIKMKCYLGYIELRNTYYNFIPQYVYDDTTNEITKIDNDELKATFPSYGSINLAYRLNNKFQEFLNAKNINDEFSSLYAVKFEDEELEDNSNDKISKKLDLQKLYDKNINLESRIQPLEQIKIYKIVTPKDSTIPLESFSGSGTILINESHYQLKEKVMLKYDEQLIGPFELQERSFDGEKYIRPGNISNKNTSNKYYFDSYKENAYDLIPFEKHTYTPTEPTYVAHLKSKPGYFDAITDSVLISKITEPVNKDLLIKNPYEFERLYASSPFLKDVPEQIRQKRIERIEYILKDIKNYDDEIKKIISKFTDDIFKDDTYNELLSEKIKNSEQYIKLEEQIDYLNRQYDEVCSERDELKDEKENLEKRIDSLEYIKNQLEEEIKSESKVSDEELENLKKAKADLESENNALNKLIKNYGDLKAECENLIEKNNKAQDMYDATVIRIRDKNNDFKKIKNEFENYIENILNKPDTRNMLDNAFDPYISNAMLEAAEKYNTKSETDKYTTAARQFIDIADKYEHQDKDKLIDNLVNNVRKFRDYSKNEILNMYICLSQNFLTIFSGEPGSGKTSICNIIANSLGLNKFEFEDKNDISLNRYVPVSVERGWSSKRDLIGYFNPLTKKYDRSNAKIYDGLMILNKEKNESVFPYIILLDEANLSPMEYYWADFMRATDDSENDIMINIGLEEDIFIPKTLRFLATINNDQTTEQLSPRLIDRAWIIKLPKTTITDNVPSYDEVFENIVLWSDLEEAFVKCSVKEMGLKAVADKIYELFEYHHLPISPRIKRSIKDYVCVAQEIMDNEGIVSPKEKALDFAIVQKLLPKINGYYDNYKRLFEALIQICDENNLNMTRNALTYMQDTKDQNMGYCQYLM